ncbi:MAG: hypothetical protein ACK2T0_02175 [Anaerolineales bacterium]
MEGFAYIPGFRPQDPGPLSRFLPPLEDGTIATWLGERVARSSWLLDPFGFSVRLPVEAARAGYRVLVTVNNPITHFLLQLEANPPLQADFQAALAELAASRKGDERLEAHFRALYATRCEQCGHENQAQAFVWRKGADAPFARIYECSECGESGERPAAQEDVDRARRIAAADALHRSRALERVASLEDADRIHAQEAIRHYLPRPLYVLVTILNRMDALDLTADRRRALTALVLAAFDSGNTLWSRGSERPRPKQLVTSDEFRERNVWLMLEEASSLWAGVGAPVPCERWPQTVPETGGICVYEGRLRGLAEEVRKETTITAVVGSIPRPNQAFWTLSALWAGWLWGRAAVDPYRVALRRRRYDWAWNATALHAAAAHLFDLSGLGTPFFALVPESEPAFLASAFTALSAAGFDLKGLAVRTEHDPIQCVWERGERLRREGKKPDVPSIRAVLETTLQERGEPVGYLHLKAAALTTLAESHALREPSQEFDEALRGTHSLIETALKQGPNFIHHSSGEGVEAGLWGLSGSAERDSLTDHAEVIVVNHLQRHPESIFLEIEDQLYQRLRGLSTPSQGIARAVLSSYANRDEATWRLRPEDTASRRRDDLRTMARIVQDTGRRLGYDVQAQDDWLLWQEKGNLVQAFTVIASALVAEIMRKNPYPPQQSILVIPGGRASLIAYKAQRDPDLAERLMEYRLAKYRMWRAVAEIPVLTRETYAEQLASDPVERAQGQMTMF